ncbi:MAG: DUF692 family multinuclear iron-containing protein [Nannocystaceae bacterium]|nr:DUF692 domain-containing protein [bacterium]
MQPQVPTGVGLGLRGAFLRDIVRGDADDKIAFLEVAPENYMHRGGRSPKRLATLAERFPIITHGLMMSIGGTDPFDEAYMAELKVFLDRYDPAWHSDHICWSGMDGAVLHDLLPIPFTTQTAKRVAARIREAADRLERPMAIENISWYLQLGKSTLDEAGFITEVLERADCGLLLDVNNVFVNASNHGFDARAWIDAVPLDRVVQLHIAGHEPWDDTLLVDTHGADVRDEVRDLLSYVIERTGAKPVLLERDSNIPPLSELLAEAASLQAVYDAALAKHQEASA